MNRLYLRIFIGILIVIIFSFSLPFIIDSSLFNKGIRNEIPEALQVPMELIKFNLERTTPEMLSMELDTLERLSDFNLTIVDYSDSSLPISAANISINGTIVNEGNFGGPPRIYVRLDNINKVLIMEPIHGMPLPETKSIVILLIALLLIISIAGFIIIWPIVKNLKSLEIAALKFGKGELDSRVIIRSRDSVGSVAQQFNLMADRIRHLIQQERQLLQAVSHELRTPISRIRFILDLLASTKSKEEQSSRIQEIDNEISEIDMLVGELIDYNRLWSDLTPLNKQNFTAGEIIDEIITRLSDTHPDKVNMISCQYDSTCSIYADVPSFKRAIVNLLTNGLKYAHSKVVIKCYNDINAAIVEIDDDGPGIPITDRERVLKPFTRLEDSRNRESGGVGLGLSIVQRILEKHNGTISIGKADIGGTRFTTKWPGLLI